MKTEVSINEEDDRTLVNFNNNHSIANLIRKGVWENGGEAGYDKGHPLDKDSKLVVDGSPETVQKAVSTCIEWAEELEEEAENKL